LKHLELKKLILIGASTGGPSHIKKILTALKPELNAAIIVAQHMGEAFIPSFISRLSDTSSIPIELAREEKNLENGHVYICSGVTNIITRMNTLRFEVDGRCHECFNPSIDTLFSSSARLLPKFEILSIILTGIGEDGVNGCLEVMQNGGQCIAESEESAIVYGMPARAKEKIKNIRVKNLNQIIQEVKKFAE